MSYPKWWNDTLTVYNKYFDEDRIAHFKRTVVKKAFYTTNLTVNVQSGDLLDVNTYGVRVRKDPNYINSLEWNPELDKYTLKADDIIVKGEIEDEIDENIKGKTINDFLNKYKGSSFVVKHVKENLKVDLAHYLATGD